MEENKNIRGRGVLYLVVSATILLFAGGGYFAYQRFVEKKAALPPVNSFKDCVNAGYPVAESYPRQCHAPNGRNFVEVVPPESTPIDTSDWKTYRSEQYGFEVRYPEGWVAQVHPSGDGVSFISALAPVVSISFREGSIDGEVRELEASVRFLSTAKVVSKRNISVDGQDGTQVTVYWPESGAENTVYTFFSSASRVYQILWTTDAGDNGQIYSQFLETLKFIE